MAIGLDAVTLIGIFVESTLYGLFVALFSISLYVLIVRRQSAMDGRINRPLLAVSIVMFILATVHVGTDLHRLMSAFLDYQGIPAGPTKFLSKVNTAEYSVKSTAYAAQTLVGDGFVLYRLHTVWKGDRRVVWPIAVCFIASIGVAIGALQGFARASPAAPVFITELHDWIVSFFSLTLFTNFSCTSLIALRIFMIQRKANTVSGRSATGRRALSAAILIIESGAIYSACLIILLSLYLSGSFAQYIVLDAVSHVVGIVFSLIIVRVGLGLSTSSSTKGGPMLDSTTGGTSSKPNNTWNVPLPRKSANGDALPMHYLPQPANAYRTTDDVVAITTPKPPPPPHGFDPYGAKQAEDYAHGGAQPQAY